MRTVLICVFVAMTYVTAAQPSWNNKRAAVVLTYDDGIDIDLDIVIPQLDSFGLKGTFYVIAGLPIISERANEWRAAAANGHELGNHTLFHPCSGGPGRGFVREDTDLQKYTVTRAVREVRLGNAILQGIDGKEHRTFAYPCGDMKIGEVYFYKELVNDFVAARGVQGAMNIPGKTDLENVNAYFINGHSAKYMTDLVDKAIETNSLVVFLFHGVGGGHSLNVGRNEHRALLHHLKRRENDVWVATMVDVAQYIRSHP